MALDLGVALRQSHLDLLLHEVWHEHGGQAGWEIAVLELNDEEVVHVEGDAREPMDHLPRVGEEGEARSVWQCSASPP